MVIIVAIILAILIYKGEQLLFSKKWYKGLDVTIDFTKKGIGYGEIGTIEEVIINDKNMPIPVLEVKYNTDKSLEFPDMSNAAVSDNYYRHDIFSLKGRQKITRTMNFKALKRGSYTIGDFDVKTRDYFMGKHYFSKGSSESRILVYPEKVNVSGLTEYLKKSFGEAVAKQVIIEDPFVFRNIRQYSKGDPRKYVNWKSTAAFGELMVNTHESTSTGKVCIISDVNSMTVFDDEELIEKVLSLSDSLAEYYLSEGTSVSLYCSSLDFPDIKSNDFFGNITLVDEAMALVDTKGKKSGLKETIDRATEEEKEDTFYILISASKKEFLSEIVSEYMGRGYIMNAIIPYNKRELKNLLQDEEMADGVILPYKVN